MSVINCWSYYSILLYIMFVFIRNFTSFYLCIIFLHYFTQNVEKWILHVENNPVSRRMKLVRANLFYHPPPTGFTKRNLFTAPTPALVFAAGQICNLFNVSGLSFKDNIRFNCPTFRQRHQCSCFLFFG